MMDIAEEFNAYKELIAKHPDAPIVEDKIGNDLIKFHCVGKQTFAAICDHTGRFKRLQVHFSLN